MKNLLIFFLVLITIQLNAQENEGVYKTTSLNFEISTLSLQSFYGGIGGKTWVSDSFTLVASVGGGYSSRSRDAVEDFSEGINKTTSIILSFGLEQHFKLDDNISPYLVERLSGSFDQWNYQPSVDTIYFSTMKESKSNQYTIGLSLGLGVEFWVTNRISLSGQYLLGAFYGWGTESSTSVDRPDQDLTTFNIGTSTSAIILAIYF